jgi:Fe-S cluster assembly ATP-binding protein
MKSQLISVRNLQVAVESKVVLSGVNLNIGAGEVHALTGKNGSGKSSLASVLMGDARYQTTDSSGVQFNEKDLLVMSPDERARAGLYLAWQSPVTIPGVTVFSLCKASYEAMGNRIDKLTEFKQKLEKLAIQVGLTKEHIGRSVNEGFSGGERKRLEMLQLLLLQPKLVILDEIDSGLDTDGLKMVAEVINKMKSTGTSFVLITHNKLVLQDVKVDKMWEMKNGQLQAWV